jgi:hypothetical protein
MSSKNREANRTPAVGKRVKKCKKAASRKLEKNSLFLPIAAAKCS